MDETQARLIVRALRAAGYMCQWDTGAGICGARTARTRVLNGAYMVVCTDHQRSSTHG